MLKTEKEIVEECNSLARCFYGMQGYKVPDDFKFYNDHHPMEIRCWDMAVLAYNHIQGTDIEDCLNILEE